MNKSARKFFTLAYSLITSEWKAVTVIILASLLQAFAVNYFTLHYRFPDLGVSGIAVLTNYAFGISPNWVILTGNIILMIWAWRDLNLHFLGLTLIAIFTFSAGLSIFALYPLSLPDDKFMATVITGLIKGFAGGMMFNIGGSSGGTDIIAAALRRRYGIEVGQFSIFINMIIIAL